LNHELIGPVHFVRPDVLDHLLNTTNSTIMSGLVSGYGSSDEEDTADQAQAVNYDASAAIRPAPEDDDEDEDDDAAAEQAKKDLYGLSGVAGSSKKANRADRGVKVAAAPDVLAEVSSKTCVAFQELSG
jgi:hypothetical protein